MNINMDGKFTYYFDKSIVDKDLKDKALEYLQLWSYENPTEIFINDYCEYDAYITMYEEIMEGFYDDLRDVGVQVLVFFKDKEEFTQAMSRVNPTKPYSWKRFPEDNEEGLEVTTKGDKRFTPFFMKLKGRTIENLYQLDLKGYRLLGCTNWKECKGKEPLKFIPQTDPWTREQVENDQDYLYIFTDNLNKTSGRNLNRTDCNYNKLYIPTGVSYYPTMTQAVIRGLDNAFPISTMKDQHGTQLTSKDSELINSVWDKEIKNILEALKTGKYKGIKFSSVQFGNGRYSKIINNAKLFKDLYNHLLKIGIRNDNPVTTNFLQDVDEQRVMTIFKNLYKVYFESNLPIFYELACLGKTRVFTDVHATSDNTQAKAYAEILNEYFKLDGRN